MSFDAEGLVGEKQLMLWNENGIIFYSGAEALEGRGLVFSL